MKKEVNKQSKKVEPFDYASFEKEAINGLYEGKGLIGEDGIFTKLMQRFINAALEGEVTAHIKEDKKVGRPNRRNGYTHKKIDTDLGEVHISPPRERTGEFEPQIVGKWSRQLGGGLDKHILMMYAHGNSYSDIKRQIREIYGVDYSESSISEVTEQVWGEVVNWQQRPLLSLYCVLFLDGMYFTSREGGKSTRKVLYSIYSIDANGERDILSIYIKESEGAHEWGRVLEDLKRRGIEDVLFCCVDGLKGFSESIEQVFPKAIVQRCIVHMVRSSTKYVSYQYIKSVCSDLRKIYSAVDRSGAEMALEAFKETWNAKYPEIAKQWEANWTELMAFMDYGSGIRKMIYTTNSVEALHRQIRKVTKTKGSWVNDKALIKQLYLILMYGSKSWNKKVLGWLNISKDLNQHFGKRFSEHELE